jgi:hypothetical protein
VSAERSRGRELAELVADHLLGDEDRDVLPIVEVRDQVRIMPFDPELFIDSMRLISRSSTYGPLRDDLLNYRFSLPLRRCRMI